MSVSLVRFWQNLNFIDRLCCQLCIRFYEDTSSGSRAVPCQKTAGQTRPGRSLPPGKTRYPLYRRLDGLQGRSGQVRKISPQPGFDPRTVQPVASRYTDYATRPTAITRVVVIVFCARDILVLSITVSSIFFVMYAYIMSCVCRMSL
jgi:hypothetical protein